jgi:hypothetical protein
MWDHIYLHGSAVTFMRRGVQIFGAGFSDEHGGCGEVDFHKGQVGVALYIEILAKGHRLLLELNITTLP